MNVEMELAIRLQAIQLEAAREAMSRAAQRRPDVLPEVGAPARITPAVVLELSQAARALG